MDIVASFNRLKDYCEREDFRGWDPYDGLNSTVFRRLPWLPDRRLPRLAWIQLMKRAPFNLRQMMGVKKEHNPKGLGLFLSGYCNLYKREPSAAYLDKIKYLADKLISLQSTGYSGSCWGYNFDWQARAFYQPRNTPTVVATTYIANALMDAWEITKEQQYLTVALGSAGFVLYDLNRSYDDKGNFAFSYSPQDHTQVFNASLLGTRLLARIYHHTRDVSLLDPAMRSAAFCCDHQQENGAWPYGTLPFHQWTDNFHTGYNLECLAAYQYYTHDHRFRKAIEKGTDYYLRTFFTEEGQPKYYNNKLYPLDVHNTAQLIITLSRLGLFGQHRPLMDKVLGWTINNMQDREGYFYYQLRRGLNVRTPYMRWAQAWMFNAMSLYLLEIKPDDHDQNSYL